MIIVTALLRRVPPRKLLVYISMFAAVGLSIFYNFYTVPICLVMIVIAIVIRMLNAIKKSKENEPFCKLREFIAMANNARMDDLDIIVTVLGLTNEQFIAAFDKHGISYLEVIHAITAFHTLVGTLHRNTMVMLQAAYLCQLEQQENGCEKLARLTGDWISFLEYSGAEETEMMRALIQKKTDILTLVRMSKLRKTSFGECVELLSVDESCSICLEILSRTNEVTLLKCKHVFHHECILIWIAENPICPLCKSEI